MEPLKAGDRDAWRLWLSANHDIASEAWLLFFKGQAGESSITYDEAVEEALCFGWIDSVIRRVDDRSYVRRFTPRRPGSNWSTSNLERMRNLIKWKKVAKRGMEVYLSRSSERLPAEAVKAKTRELPAEFEKRLRQTLSRGGTSNRSRLRLGKGSSYGSSARRGRRRGGDERRKR